MAVTQDETTRMAQTLRAMASRTGNAAAEKTMRDAAQYLDALSIQYTRLAEECDKLREKLADKEEQLAGWKRLVDSIGVPARSHNKVPAHARSRRRAFDYAAAIRKFMDSGVDVATISALASRDENSDVLGEVAPAQADVLVKAAERMGAPVAARKCGNYLVLERTDRRAAP